MRELHTDGKLKRVKRECDLDCVGYLRIHVEHRASNSMSMWIPLHRVMNT